LSPADDPAAGAAVAGAAAPDEARPPAVDRLLLDVQRRLETLYALGPHPPVTDFLLSQRDAARFPGGGSRTLVTQDGDEVSLAVVLEEAVGERLAEADPRVHLDGRNLAPFCTLTEEVSHFVYLLFCARTARSITELELELQGELDKYLTAAFFLSLQNEGAVSTRLRELLFRNYRLRSGLTAERAERYHAASGLAYRYCGYLEERYIRSNRLLDLAREARRFYRLGQRQKLERIAEVA
jgi:hypothetical protein